MANKTIPELTEKTEFTGSEKIPMDSGTQTYGITLDNFALSLLVDLQAFHDSLDSLVQELEV